MATEKHENGGEQHTGLRAPLGWWGRASEFIAEVRSEMKRVTWPSRREVYATTIVVILTSMFFGVYLFGVDLALGKIVETIFNRFGAA
jgi:preprotein translocase subunit SecE